MNTLSWAPPLALQHPQLDETHEEFVALLGRFEEAVSTPMALPRLRDLLAHTEAHFGLEERWLTELGFEADNCHSRQHAMVLELMRAVLSRAEQGELAPLPRLAPALAQWFPEHVEVMDAALVLALQKTLEN